MAKCTTVFGIVNLVVHFLESFKSVLTFRFLTLIAKRQTQKYNQNY